ncbi:YcgN family cysteine cluster protein [Marinobacter bohaiensis]|uniref:YcgN family cysteine cluster protein n=1 Tax=Marinobacter bohaiensis TaxID=2201898 RepID=UPI000DAD473A|nr:YcgN family cysteine cluster protein [Marinobacter bohaiensis]
MIAAIPFWQRKRFDEMSRNEWESLCDGCGKCCLTKLEDADTGDVYYTDLACQYMDGDTCQCTVYSERQAKEPDCIVLTPESVSSFHWLPQTCAYRLLAEDKPLPDWHPLVSGDPDSVHRAQVSVRQRTVSNAAVDEDDWEEHIIHWVL